MGSPKVRKGESVARGHALFFEGASVDVTMATDLDVAMSTAMMIDRDRRHCSYGRAAMNNETQLWKLQ